MSTLCIGQFVADVVVRPVDSLPPLGRTELVQDLQIVTGGCAANTASVLAKLGENAVAAGLIGTDRLGDLVIADLTESGVNVKGISRDCAIPTSAVIVVVNGVGERSFLYREGGNEHLNCERIPDHLLRAAKIVHLGGAMKLRKLDLFTLLTKARDAGCLTSLDTDWDTTGAWMNALSPALPVLDFLLTNEEEGSMLTGLDDPVEIGRSLMAKGPKIVVVKRGPLGAIAVSSEGVLDTPAFDVSVLDTTCAGDSFAAGFLVGVTRGWKLNETLRFANAVGGLCTTQISHKGVVSLEAALEFIKLRV